MKITATPKNRGSQGWVVRFELVEADGTTHLLFTEQCTDQDHMQKRLDETYRLLRRVAKAGVEHGD